MPLAEAFTEQDWQAYVEGVLDLLTRMRHEQTKVDIRLFLGRVRDGLVQAPTYQVLSHGR